MRSEPKRKGHKYQPWHTMMWMESVMVASSSSYHILLYMKETLFLVDWDAPTNMNRTWGKEKIHNNQLQRIRRWSPSNRRRGCILFFVLYTRTHVGSCFQATNCSNRNALVRSVEKSLKSCRLAHSELSTDRKTFFLDELWDSIQTRLELFLDLF